MELKWVKPARAVCHQIIFQKSQEVVINLRKLNFTHTPKRQEITQSLKLKRIT